MPVGQAFPQQYAERVHAEKTSPRRERLSRPARSGECENDRAGGARTRSPTSTIVIGPETTKRAVRLHLDLDVGHGLNASRTIAVWHFLRRPAVRLVAAKPIRPTSTSAALRGVAAQPRARGHALAPSTRAVHLVLRLLCAAAGRAADVIALCPSRPVARRTHMGVPVGVRANLTHALANGRYDIVHGFERGWPRASPTSRCSISSPRGPPL